MTSRRSPSLRTRVVVAATLVTTLVVVVISGLLWRGAHVEGYKTIDGRLAIAVATAVPTANVGTNPSAGGEVISTLRIGAGLTQNSSDVEIPRLDPGITELLLHGVRYRIQTASIGDIGIGNPPLLYSVGIDIADTERVIAAQRQLIVVGGLLAIGAAALLSWLFATLALRPLRRLSVTTAGLDGAAGSAELRAIHGAREAEEIAAAIDGLLGRVEDARRRTEEALETSRDFASVAGHELRTPLTAMRTDLEVLATMNPPEADRAEILADVRRAHSRVLDTLASLEALAQGELQGTGRELDDVADLADRVVTESARLHPDVEIVQVTDEPAIAPVLASGVRMAIGNAVTNAVRHGRATRVEVAVRTRPDPDDPAIIVTVDDDGVGIPEADRARLFERFARGGSQASGSGLGLTLIAQQAALHGGSATLTDSPLGGTRLTLRLRAAPQD